MERYEKRIKRTNLFFLVLIIFYIIFTSVIGLFIKNDMLKSAAGELSILVVGIIFLVIQKENIAQYIRLKRIDVVTIIFSLLYAICLIPTVSIINAISMVFVKNFAASSLDEMSNSGFWPMFVVVAIIPAIVEEFLFRGIIYRGYRQARPIRGIIYSAFLFGAMHMNFNQLCYAFFMGASFALIDEIADSIWPSVWMHCLFNGQSVVLVYAMNVLTEKLGDVGILDSKNVLDNMEQTTLTTENLLSTVLIYLPFAIAGLAIGFVLLVAIAKRSGRYAYVMSWFSKEYKEDRKQLPKPRIISVSFVIAVLICLGVCIFMEVMKMQM